MILILSRMRLGGFGEEKEEEGAFTDERLCEGR